MSNRYEREAEDLYEDENDPSPVSGTFHDNSYAHETQSSLRNQVPVARDQAPYEDPVQPPYSNTDQQLAQDEDEAIDQSNVIPGRTRGAKPQTRNQYSEGPDEDDLPDEVLYGNVGTSSTRREVINSFHPHDHEIVPVPGLVAVCAGRGPVSGFDSGLRAMR
ncbi:hypothetical protein AnigIFM60653_004050 [Aspergillus niger]|nr:hypothetical protein AnigIFM49718_011851 [Aspergillus niger]GLA04020.1 hypothetical protein AnigIFM60653_004050 [Aspergillus niger]GLA35212.1 hypothetical protein AnigIFM63309_010103 [Aspergillus niger]